MLLSFCPENTLWCFQVYQAAPQVLTPVMPSLLDELRDQDDAKRLGALDLLGKLFSLQGSEACSAFPELFQEFLRRSTDQKASPSLMSSSRPGLSNDWQTQCYQRTYLGNVLWHQL